MMARTDELIERRGRISETSGSASIWWRPSLGQATFDLIAAGQPVTIEALVERLELSVKPDELVHRKLSAKAAIDVLESLAEQRLGSEQKAPEAPRALPSAIEEGQPSFVTAKHLWDDVMRRWQGLSSYG